MASPLFSCGKLSCAHPSAILHVDPQCFSVTAGQLTRQHDYPLRRHHSLRCLAFTSSGQYSNLSEPEQANEKASPSVLPKPSRHAPAADVARQPAKTLPRPYESFQGQEHIVKHDRRSPAMRQVAENAELPMPVQMSLYIKDQWRAAVRGMRTAAPAGVLSLYLSRMDHLVSTSQNHLDHIHITAILHGTSKVWMSADRFHGGWHYSAPPNVGLEALMTKLLTGVEQLLPKIDARTASSMLHSFAKLQLNPDTLVPGAVDCLAQQLIKDLEFCSGHSYASVLIACVELQISPCKGDLLKALVQHLNSADLSSFVPQDITNITHSLARLPRAKPSSQLLDALCDGLLLQLQSQSDATNPQGVSIFAWSLQQLKHVPSSMVAAAMLSRMFEFCHDDRHNLKPQQISNFLLAYADLRLNISSEQVEMLVTHLMQLPKVNAQDLSNTAWAAAVLGSLPIDTFKQILHSMHRVSTATQPVNIANMQQLYQAWNWLAASSNPQLKRSKAWLEMQTQLQRIGQRPPAVRSRSHKASELALSAALAELGLQHASGSHTKSYNIDAVVHPPGSPTPTLICWAFPDCFTNQPERLTGRAVFWRKLVSQEGTLLQVPVHLAEGSTQELVEHLRPRLHIATGGSV